MPQVDRQTLNAADRLMLVAHNGLRGVGHAGFICQTHAWLTGRVDAPRLRAALARLHRRYPVITSRLEDAGGRSVPCWRFRRDAPPTLHESTRAESGEAAIWAYAARLFEQPLDLERMDPISFHLLHLPDDRDVLVLVFSHVLMDGKAPEFALKELDRFFHEESPDDDPPSDSEPASDGDEMAAHLYRFDARRRRRAAWNVIRSHIRVPQRPVIMTPPEMKNWLGSPYGICVRRLDEAQTDVLMQRIRRLCGFANPTPALVAAAFRAVAARSPVKQTARSLFQTDLPLNLRPPGRTEPIFRNFMSFVQMSARKSHLADRDDATRMFNAQLRDQIRRGIDLGNLQMMHVMAPRANRLRKHIIARMKNQPFTLGFGFLGPVAPGLNRIFDQDVRWLYSLNSAISPPGVTLQANQSGNGLNIMLTWIESAVPRATAVELVDRVIDDLTRP